MCNKRVLPQLPLSRPQILNEEDVLVQLRVLLAHGYGQLQIDIFDHYIRVIRPQPTLLGQRPS